MSIYSKITNPLTGRKVNIDGKIGRQIIKNYLNHLSGGSGPECSADAYNANINHWIDHCDEMGNGDGICDYQDLVLMPGNNRHFWTICENYGDGHCFYWTLLRHFESTGTQEDITNIGHNLDAVAEIRMRILDELQRRREVGLAQNPPRNAISEETLYRQQEGIQDAFNGDYTGAWAEDHDISAASQVFNLCIGVWNPAFGMWTFTSPPETDRTELSIQRDGVCDHPNLLFTVNTNMNHFDTLLPKNPEEAAENAQQMITAQDEILAEISQTCNVDIEIAKMAFQMQRTKNGAINFLKRQQLAMKQKKKKKKDKK